MDDVLRRGGDVATLVDAWRSLDEQRRKLQGELDGLRQQRNAANERMRSSTRSRRVRAGARRAEGAVDADQGRRSAARPRSRREVEDELLGIPNAPHASVPDGDERGGQPGAPHVGREADVRVRAEGRTGTSARRSASSTSTRGAKITGARFTVLRGGAAKLTRALHQLHARSPHAARLRRGVAAGGRRARARCAAPASSRSSRRDLFKLATAAEPGSRAPITICSCRRPPRSRSRTSTPTRSSRPPTLPKHYCAYAPCFRAEAGAARQGHRAA